ncbi:MAG: DUF4129 domain-containing protein [Chloroflexi bacterium]|nr:DUF4129 domain-containing protein [Chloroflexota bacterium]MBU1751355.1 DUF4129 domain-containing protein [Chloroflexota bacterium]MBU1877430.1 DUF4129 domain-containing protein [Chloroflexota bacterium]
MNWRQEIVAICLAVMEVCWLRPLLVFLMEGQADNALPPLAILGLLLVAYWGSRVIIASRLSLRWARALILSSMVLSILGVIWFWRYDAYLPLDPTWLMLLLQNLSHAASRLNQPDLVAVLAGVYLWWRGIIMTRSGQTFSRAFDGFRWGLVWLLVVGLAQSLSGIELQVIPYGFEFFVFGLTAMAIGRLDEIDQRGQLQLRRDRYWIPILAGAIALVLGLSLGSAMLFGADLGGILLAILGPIGWVFQVVVYTVLLIMGYFAQLLVSLLHVVFPPPPEGTTIDSGLLPGQAMPTPIVVEVYELPPAIQFSVQALVGIGLTLLILVIVARAILRWQRSISTGETAIHESLFSAADLGDDLSNWLRNLWGNLQDRFRRPAELLPLPAETDPLYASIAIRRIYVELLAAASQVGLTRMPGQTPHEYLPRLQFALPQHTGALRELTTVYARARYDALRTTRVELDLARTAWDQLRPELEHLPPPPDTPAITSSGTQNTDELSSMLVRGRPGA